MKLVFEHTQIRRAAQHGVQATPAVSPLQEHIMRPLRYSINVTLDGCCDHRAIPTDEDLHRHAAENLAQADALLFGRVTYEMMEAAWRPTARTGARPDWKDHSASNGKAAVLTFRGRAVPVLSAAYCRCPPLVTSLMTLVTARFILAKVSTITTSLPIRCGCGPSCQNWYVRSAMCTLRGFPHRAWEPGVPENQEKKPESITISLAGRKVASSTDKHLRFKKACTA